MRDTTVKTCKSCNEVKPVEEFTHKNARCDECLSAGKNGENEYRRFNENLRKLTESVRYMNARRIRGYKFKGEIPEPKEPSYYYWAD